jgi:hypothetical protein
MDRVLGLLFNLQQVLDDSAALRQHLQQLDPPTGANNGVNAPQNTVALPAARATDGCAAAEGQGRTAGDPAWSLEEVDVCALNALCSQPVLTGSSTWPRRTQAQQQCPQQQQEVGAVGDADEGDEYGCAEVEPDSTAEEVEMMTSLEMARAVST